VEERDFLIAAHERSEAALAGHAGSLTGNLQTAAAHIEQLFARQGTWCCSAMFTSMIIP
jgi:hypothetical protein